MNEGKDVPPSYEESSQSKARDESLKISDAQSTSISLPQQLSETRGRRINAIISSYIDPLLQSQASAGLSQSTLVLIPSNESSLQAPKDILEGTGNVVSRNAEESLVGFPSNDHVKLVRLHGEEYTSEFWRQAKVMAELESALKARLQAGGHQIADNSAPSQQQEASEPLPQKKKGFFGLGYRTA